MRATLRLDRYGLRLGRWYLCWRDPWTRRFGLALDDGRRACFDAGFARPAEHEAEHQR